MVSFTWLATEEMISRASVSCAEVYDVHGRREGEDAITLVRKMKQAYA